MVNERALSMRQAWNCEWALDNRCRCRCGGKLHGAKRIDHDELLEQLPADDPHYIKPEIEHPLGPMRKVVNVEKRAAWSYWNDSKRGTYRLTLECGHSAERKMSRKPPKQLHCMACRVDENSKTSSTGTKSLVRQPAAGEYICPKCRQPFSKHTKSEFPATGEVRFYCLQIPATAHKAKNPQFAGKRRSELEPIAKTAKRLFKKLRESSRTSRKSSGRSR